MKRYISVIMASALLFVGMQSITSCQDALDTKIYGEIVPESFFQTESDLEAAVVGMMIYVSGRGVGTDYGLWTSHWVAPRLLGMQIADELYKSGGNDRVWSTWQFTPSSGAKDNGGGRPEYNWAVWQFNAVCAKITSLLHDFENCPIASSNPQLVEEYSKQLKGLRALYMYTLYEFFGPVNTTLKYEELNSNEPKARLSEEAYRTAIESDLAAVMDSQLPDVQTGSMRGYVSKDFFRMLGIRYYMRTQQWAKAEALCRYILTTGNYSLITTPGETVTYTDADNVSHTYTFSPYEVAVNTCPNSETIFSCPADKSHGNIWVTEITQSGTASQGPGTGSVMSGWGMGYMPWEHLHSLFGYAGDDAYEKDTRVRQIMTEVVRNIRVTNPDGTTSRVPKLCKENPDPNNSNETSLVGAYPIKFTNWYTSSYSEFEIEQPAYRLSDVYLYLAECIARQSGVTSEAIGLVADIRERAGLGRDLTKNLTQRQQSESLNPTSSTEAFLNLILWERGRELMCEGQRWEDLNRFGMLVQRAYEQNRIDNIKENEHRTLLPLPHDVVLQSNGVIEQNPGYPTAE